MYPGVCMHMLSALKRSTAFFCLFLPLVMVLIASSLLAFGQSTFGAIIGTVKDASGAVIKGANVTLLNTGTATQRQATTDSAGSYSFLNLEAGHYKVTVAQSGFATVDITHLNLEARETMRVDASLKVSSTAETVNVEGGAIGMVTTDSSTIEAARTGQELVDLPVAIYSRSTGSTSPISTLTTQPGVQTDGSTLIIQGSTTALTAVTLDGISTMSIEYAGPINELFPSFNSISEMKVTSSNNSAEFGGVADITTTSKSGTNLLHGGAFWNGEYAALDAGNPFAQGKPKLVMNNFGGYAGGPIIRDKAFFFASYEGLRLPLAVPIVTSVPSNGMRNGNLCNYLTAAYGAGKTISNYDGSNIPCNAVPISSVSANFLKYLLPAPNTGDPDSFSNNYQENLATPISSDQGDGRIDYNLTSKQSIFGRVTYKDRSVTTAPDPYHPFFWEVGGSPSTGPFSQPETDSALTLAYNYSIKPTLLNELRGGYSRYHLQTTLNVNSQDILNQLGLLGIPNVSPYGAVPNVIFGGAVGGFQQTGGANPSTQVSNTIEISDNLTWIKQNHTFKFGFDWRRLSDSDDNAFGSIRSGQYAFDGQSSAVGVTIGDPYTSFLLGYPDYELITLISNDKMNGLGYAYGFFAQDQWQVTPSFTLNLGLRYELHPPMHDTGYNSGALLPNYQGNPHQTALVVPNQQAVAMADPGLIGSVPNTPLLTAAQAGIPEALRYTSLSDWGPRIGFAWRPFHNDKTVIRGGYGRFIEAPLGFALVAGWATTTSYIPFYGNGYSGPNNTGTPVISFPSPWPNPIDQAEPGGASFYYAFPVHYKDPSVQQWNATFEHELGFDTGFRLSYVGNHGSNLEIMQDLNQVPANTVGYSVAGAYRPYQDWTIIESVTNSARSNYNSLTADVHKRFGNGLQFESSYVWTSDLSTAGGGNPTALPVQPANFMTSRFNSNLDYGNVIYDRRSRFLTTVLYNLPLGKGKALLGNASGALNGLVGGWQAGGVLVFQSGPFLTPYQTTCDSAGTNEITVTGSAHADIVPGASFYAPSGATSGGFPLYLNPQAFTIPGTQGGGCNAIGRFGNARPGSVVGPGTSVVSMSMIKTVPVAERARFQIGLEASNLFNHPNLAPPNMQVGSSGFGTINAVQTAEGAGPRILEFTARITF